MDKFRLNLLPRELLLQQTQLLNNKEVKALCASNPVFNQRICRSEEFYQQRFEVEVTPDREWLRDNFLKDERYRTTPLDDIPAKAFNYYEALREVRLLFSFYDPELNDIIGINHGSMKDTMLLAIRHNFIHLAKIIFDDVVKRPQDYNDNTITVAIQWMLHHNRLEMFKYLVTGIIGNDTLHLRTDRIMRRLEIAHGDVNLNLRLKIIAGLKPDRSDLERFPVFSREFLDYLSLPLVDAPTANMLDDYHLAVALYNDDTIEFEKYRQPYNSILVLLCGADAVNITKPTINANNGQHVVEVSLKNSATKILNYILSIISPPDLLTIQNKLSRNLKNTLLLTYDLTTDNIRKFFPADSLQTWANTVWGRNDKGEFAEISTNFFRFRPGNQLTSNYRALVRAFIAQTQLSDVYNMIVNILSIAPEWVLNNAVNTLVLLQELLRIDLVTNSGYRQYLSLLFPLLDSIPRANRLMLPFLYLAHVKYYYLNNSLPTQPFQIKVGRSVIFTAYQPDALVIRLAAYKDMVKNTFIDRELFTMTDYVINREWNVDAHLILTGIQDREWLLRQL